MHYVEDIINVAKEEIGYFEKATDKDLDEKTSNVGNGHYTKYARDLDNIGFYNTCQNGMRDVFVPWCFVQAFGANAAKEICNIPTDACADYNSAIEYYGQLYCEPKIGDQIFFYDDEHNISNTALVELVTNKLVYTIGLGIFGISRNCYELDDASIAGYGRPKYDSAETIDGPITIIDIQKWLNEEFNSEIPLTGIYDKCTKEALANVAKQVINVKSFGIFGVKDWPIIKRGSIGYRAKIIQAALICNGYSCGKFGANGYFNDDSVEALKRFQATHKMIIDGLAGKAVMSLLFE